MTCRVMTEVILSCQEGFMLKQYIMVLVTTANMAEAETISKTLVFEKLAACVNIVDKVRSIYQWEGKIHDESEHLLLIKSTAEHFDTIEKRIKELHSYEVPEIIALPIEKGSQQYLQWLSENTHQAKA